MIISLIHNMIFYPTFPRSRPEPVVVDMAPLLRIFQGIITCLGSAGASHSKTRCSLYGAILYYMQVGKLQTSVNEKGSILYSASYMLCYFMLFYVMLCYVMLCYVMLCYVILCYVTLCFNMF